MEPLRYRILAEAVRETDEAGDYYEAKSSGLGEAFDREVRRTIERICRMPTAGSLVSPRARICRTHRFPYGVVFERRANEIVILAVSHLHREPGYWNDRAEGG